MSETTTGVQRSGPAIRAALVAHAPDEVGRFEEEFHHAARTAGERFDVIPLERVLDRWWGIAAIRANPLSEHEQQQLAAARQGDTSGWFSQDEPGPS